MLTHVTCPRGSLAHDESLPVGALLSLLAAALILWQRSRVFHRAD